MIWPMLPWLSSRFSSQFIPVDTIEEVLPMIFHGYFQRTKSICEMLDIFGIRFPCVRVDTFARGQYVIDRLLQLSHVKFPRRAVDE